MTVKMSVLYFSKFLANYFVSTFVHDFSYSFQLCLLNHVWFPSSLFSKPSQHPRFQTILCHMFTKLNSKCLKVKTQL